jgi:hypothetical protein
MAEVYNKKQMHMYSCLHFDMNEVGRQSHSFMLFLYLNVPVLKCWLTWKNLQCHWLMTYFCCCLLMSLHCWIMVVVRLQDKPGFFQYFTLSFTQKILGNWKLYDFVKCYLIKRPPLWSCGQSSWLQIQRSRVRFPALPDFLRSSESGTGSTQPREDNWGATWVEK